MTTKSAEQKPMRVCMLTYSFYNSDTRVQQYATALVGSGDSVDVVGLKRKGEPSKEVINGVNVHGIQERKRTEKSQFAYAFKILLFLLRSTIFIAREHLKKSYQLIHIHNVPDFLVFAALVPRLTSTPVILDIHDVLPEFYASKFKVNKKSLAFKLFVLVERWSIAFSNHVIIANHIWRQRLVSRSARPEKCTPICNYPDPRFFFPRSRSRSDGKFVIMYPGTLNWHNGLDIAIRAFARIADQIPDAEFYIYGEGPTKNSLMVLAHELGLDGRVIFKEFVPTWEIARLMGEADLGLDAKRASLFGDEAASTKIPEFMALGVPVVASAITVTRYYQNDTRLKFFEPENDADLAACILQLKRDRGLREQLVSNATKYIEANNWEVKKQEYLNLVDSLVHGRTGPRPTEHGFYSS